MGLWWDQKVKAGLIPYVIVAVVIFQQVDGLGTRYLIRFRDRQHGPAPFWCRATRRPAPAVGLQHSHPARHHVPHRKHCLLLCS